MEIDRAYATPGSLSIISLVMLSSGTHRVLEEEVTQSDPGGEV